MADITPRVVEALSRLRVHARLHSNPNSLRDAIDTLDNAGVFREIDEATDYDVKAER
ncbi:hypothetical protein ABT282_07245 [Streptomyces sp. NPDC000927]|uniref:hypothetical protein n=1 Tax=Streptomyces sp. NPDC000927 TaxID=3154371 RepID=UPI003320DD60